MAGGARAGVVTAVPKGLGLRGVELNRTPGSLALLARRSEAFRHHEGGTCRTAARVDRQNRGGGMGSVGERSAEITGDCDHHPFRIQHPPGARAQQELGIAGDRPAAVKASHLAQAGNSGKADRDDPGLKPPGGELIGGCRHRGHRRDQRQKQRRQDAAPWNEAFRPRRRKPCHSAKPDRWRNIGLLRDTSRNAPCCGQ